MGTLFGGVSFSSSRYAGSQSIPLSASLFQYVQITSIYLAQQSFMIEGWINLFSSVIGEFGIFGQCDSNLKCLSITVRNCRIAVSFDSMNTNSTLLGSSLLTPGDWIHLAVLYDASLYQQQVYINGVLDAISTGVVTPYQGSSSGLVTTIGRTMTSIYGTTYFNG